jgi:hypothetical protein
MLYYLIGNGQSTLRNGQAKGLGDFAFTNSEVGRRIRIS